MEDNKKRDEVCKKYASQIIEEYFPHEDLENEIEDILKDMYKEIKE